MVKKLGKLIFAAISGLFLFTAAFSTSALAEVREEADQLLNGIFQDSVHSLTADETAGGFTVSDVSADAVYNYSTPILTISSGALTVSTNGQETSDRIYIDGACHVTLDNVNIKTSSGSAIKIADDATFDVEITLKRGSENTLDVSAATDPVAGLEKSSRDTTTGTLTVNGGGSLCARGGDGSAIGARPAKDGITICSFCNFIASDVYLKAYSVSSAAAIGSSTNGTASGLSFQDAHIYAESADSGSAAIGGAVWEIARDISFKHCSVEAVTRTSDAAAIGGGSNCAGSSISITQSLIYAYGGSAAIGGSNASQNNSIDESSVVFAARSNASNPALSGFTVDTLKKGMVFRGLVSDFASDTPAVSWEQGKVYGDMVLSKEVTDNVTVPVNTSISALSSLQVSDGATLVVPSGCTLINEGEILSTNNIDLSQGGAITTLNKFYKNGDVMPSTTNYETYMEGSHTIKTYTQVPDFNAQSANSVHGWFTQTDGKGYRIYNGRPVLLNEHMMYEYQGNEYFISTDGVEHGTISLDKEIANPGEKVHFTVLPDEGYELKDGSINVQDDAGTTIDFTLTDGTYTFDMPDSPVNISAQFVLPDPGPTPPGPTPPGPTPEPTPDPQSQTAGDSDSALLPLTGEIAKQTAFSAGTAIVAGALIAGFIGTSWIKKRRHG